MFVCPDLRRWSNVSITVSPSALSLDVVSCFEIFAGNQELFLLINKVFLFSPVTRVFWFPVDVVERESPELDHRAATIKS